MAQRAFYTVTVAGQNISSRLGPLLTSLRTTDQEGTHSDTAEIVIDDTNDSVALPRTGDLITIALGWEGGAAIVVFEGKVDEVKSSGSRGGGREIRISAKGVDTKGKAKEPQQLHIDDASVKDALTKAGKAAGVTSIEVDPEFANIRRAWWGLNDESFLHFGDRIAREIGGIFKVKDTKAILAKKGGGSVSGQSMPVIAAMWGDNLISWDISPEMGRPRHKQTRARYFDRKEAKWKSVTVEVDDDDAEATASDRFSRTDKEEADGSASNSARDAERERGGGQVEIDGNGAAKPGGTCIIVGAKRGVDGAYRIESVEHSYSRGGWTTRLELKQPQGEATDTQRGAAAQSKSTVTGRASGPV